MLSLALQAIQLFSLVFPPVLHPLGFLAFAVVIGGMFLFGFLQVNAGRHEHPGPHLGHLARARIFVAVAAVAAAGDLALRIALGAVQVDIWWLRWPALTALAAGIALFSGIGLAFSLRSLVKPRRGGVLVAAVAAGTLAPILPAFAIALADLDLDFTVLSLIGGTGFALAFVSLGLFLAVALEASWHHEIRMTRNLAPGESDLTASSDSR